MNRYAKKYIVISMLSIGITSFAVKLLLFYYLLGISPQTPNLSTGEIYALNNHGHIFYVTKTQNIIQDATFYIFIVLAFGAAFLNLRWKAIANPHDNLPKKLIK